MGVIWGRKCIHKFFRNLILEKIIIVIFPRRPYLNLKGNMQVRGRNFYAPHIESPPKVKLDDMISMKNIWNKFWLEIIFDIYPWRSYLYSHGTFGIPGGPGGKIRVWRKARVKRHDQSKVSSKISVGQENIVFASGVQIDTQETHAHLTISGRKNSLNFEVVVQKRNLLKKERSITFRENVRMLQVECR